MKRIKHLLVIYEKQQNINLIADNALICKNDNDKELRTLTLCKILQFFL